MNLLKLVAAGHAATNDVHKVENMVVAGLGEAAHVANPDHAVQTIIDRAQQTEAPVKGELEHTVKVVTHNPASVPAHTWDNPQVQQSMIKHVHIPVFEGTL